MSNRKRRKPPSERRAEQPDHRREFELAYAREVMATAPCAGCGDPNPAYAGVWSPDRQTLEENGLDTGEGHHYVIRLCNACLARGRRDPAFVALVEDRILARAKRGGVVSFEVPGGA
jgi:hypothetical protein